MYGIICIWLWAIMADQKYMVLHVHGYGLWLSRNVWHYIYIWLWAMADQKCMALFIWLWAMAEQKCMALYIYMAMGYR